MGGEARHVARGCVHGHNDPDASEEGFVKNFKSRAKDIRKRFKEYFQLDDDPFLPYREPPPGYKTKFHILDARVSSEDSGPAPSSDQRRVDWSTKTPEEFLEAHPEFAPDQDDNDYR